MDSHEQLSLFETKKRDTSTDRKCIECGEMKPLDKFERDTRARRGRRGVCHDCRARNKSSIKLIRRTIPYPDKDYTCPICDKTLDLEGHVNGRIWHVDHCHTTGKFRGHLCPTCNSGIGHLRDDPTLVRNALKYLEDFYAKENE